MNDKKDDDFLTFTSEFKPSGVIMLDCLRQNDVTEDKTGLRIFDQLRDLNEFRSEKKILCRRHVAETADALRDCLKTLADELPQDFAYIIHLECHGGEGFIEIGDRREQMTWQELMGLLTPLNVKNKCNVGLVLACCNGFGSFKVEDLAAPVPFYFQLSHLGVIYSDVLEASLTKFYRIILTEHDMPAAIRAAAPFQMKYAETMFARLIYAIMRSESRRKSDEEHINAVLTGILAQGGIWGNPDVAFNRKFVKKYTKTFEERIVSTVQSNMTFFCGRKPAFDLQKLVAWISDGKTLT